MQLFWAGGGLLHRSCSYAELKTEDLSSETSGGEVGVPHHCVRFSSALLCSRSVWDMPSVIMTLNVSPSGDGALGAKRRAAAMCATFPEDTRDAVAPPAPVGLGCPVACCVPAVQALVRSL